MTHDTLASPLLQTELSRTASLSLQQCEEQKAAATVAGIRFDAVTMEEAAGRILQMVLHPVRAYQVGTANLDHLAMLRTDAEFLEAYRDTDLVLADGMPVLWLARLAGVRLPERVAGSDLFWELGRLSAETGTRLFFLGGGPGSAERATAAVLERYPAAQICGQYCPSAQSFGAVEEEARIEAAVRSAQPDVLLVALGAPKQEKWIKANKSRLGVPVSIGVGGSFEMAGGQVKRAPHWMRRVGLEWSYRLFQEPGRLWRRYLLRDVPALCRLAVQALRSRSHNLETQA